MGGQVLDFVSFRSYDDGQRNGEIKMAIELYASDMHLNTMEIKARIIKRFGLSSDEADNEIKKYYPSESVLKPSLESEKELKNEDFEKLQILRETVGKRVPKGFNNRKEYETAIDEKYGNSMAVPMKKICIEVPEQIAPLVEVKDKETERKRDAMLIYPYIQDETISFGLAAEMIGMNRLDLIALYGKLGIDYVNMTDEEFEDEMRTVERIKAKL